MGKASASQHRSADIVSSSEDSDVEAASDASANSQEEDAFSSDDSSEDEMTQRSATQPGETLEHAPIAKDLKGPMMEQKACSNVWYRASVLRSSRNEIYIQFPAAKPGDEDLFEWVSKTSSRIWRGPMGKSAWKYLNDGAWEPRPQGKRGRSRSGSRLASRPSSRKRSRQDPGEDTGTSGLSAAETSERLANRDADDSSTRPSTHLAHSSRLRQSTGTAGIADRPATSTSLDQLETAEELKEPLASADGQQIPELHLADPLARWFQQHFLALDAAGMLGLPYACSAESGVLPKGCSGRNASHEPASLEGMSQPAEDRSSLLDPQAAPAQQHSSHEQPMSQAASPPHRHAAHEQHDDNPAGRRLGGTQDRGYRDGKPPTDAGGTSMAAEPPSHAFAQPSKRPSKSVRMRAQRCLEDSSDDCSDGAPHQSQPQGDEQQPGSEHHQTTCRAQSSTEPPRPTVGERELKRLLECDVFAGPRDRRARGQAKSSKEPQASSSSSDSGQSGTKQLDKKGGETEIESSPSPLSHAAPPSSTRPSAANLPTQHGQPLQRPHSAPVSTLKRVACPTSKGPRPQSAPDGSKPARPKQPHVRESAVSGPLSNGTHALQAKSLPQPSGPGRPPVPTPPVQPADGQHKASQPEARQQLTDRALPAAETGKAHTISSRKTVAGLANGKQSTEGRASTQSLFNRGSRDAQQTQAGSHPHCKDPKHPKAASAGRHSHALVPTDCFDNLSRA